MTESPDLDRILDGIEQQLDQIEIIVEKIISGQIQTRPQDSF